MAQSERGAAGRKAYDAFISYSHARDRAIAVAVQRALHRLARPWYRPRALRVFRDETSLSASPHLWTSIEQALASSRFFLLMASPEAAASPWVRREIRYWQEHRDQSTFLVVVTSGEVVWSGDDFDWERTTALPPQLGGWFREEPLWIPLDQDRSDDDTRLSLRNAGFRAAVCRLAAPVHGRAPDELDGEDVRQFRVASRLRRAAVAALSLLLVAATALGLVAVRQRAVAIGERDRAEQQVRIASARALAAEADGLAARDPVLAARLAVAAYRLDASPQVLASLMRAVDRHRHEVGFLEREPTTPGSDGRAFPDGRAGDVRISPDDRLVAVGSHSTGEVRLWDVATGDLAATLRTDLRTGSRESVRSTFSPDGERLVITASGGFEVWHVADRRRLLARESPDGHQVVQTRPDGGAVGFLELDRTGVTVSVHVTATDRADAPFEKVADGPDAERVLLETVGGPEAVAADAVMPDAIESGVAASAHRVTVLSAESRVETWDVAGGRKVASRQLSGTTGRWSALDTSDDGTTVVVGDDRGQLVVLDGDLTQEWPSGQLTDTSSYVDVNRDGSLAAVSDIAGNVLLLRPHDDRRFDVLPGTAGRLEPDGDAEDQRLVPSPDGRWLLVHRTRATELWRLDDRRLVAEYPADADRVLRATPMPFTADSRTFAVASGGRVVARDVDTLREVASEPGSSDLVEQASAFARVLGEERVVVRNLADQSNEVVVVGPRGERPLFTTTNVTDGPRGHVVVIADHGGDQRVHVWDLRDGSADEPTGFDYRAEPAVVAASPAADRVVIGGYGPEAEVVDLATAGRTRLVGGSGPAAWMLTEYGFLGDTDLLVQHTVPHRDANDFRNRLLVWHTGTGTLVGEWPEPTRQRAPGQQPYHVAVAGDHTALTVRPDGSIAAWHVHPEAWARSLCATFGDLDEEQRRLHQPEGSRGPVC
ncbi:toll/interleukin-1 receptor domain-containing protein [Saccharothrix saharensis]|uniref:toll/interleukin-1 receptor domain-containing protein n=1 Tax=Saccharothrix saharensis TaxID=571190 RepID=UPI00369404FF